MTDRFTTRGALIDLAIVVSQGHLANLDAANMSSDAVNTGERLQGSSGQ